MTELKRLADELWASAILEHLEARAVDTKSCKGLDTFEASVQTDPSDAERHLYVATLNVLSGRDSDAERSYQAALTADPSCSDAYLELVLFLETRQRFDEARRIALQAINANARWRNQWQRPPIFTSGLASRAWWSRSFFPWADDLEASFSLIKAELLTLMDRTGFRPGQSSSAWPKVGDERASQDGDIVSNGEWREYVIFSSEGSGSMNSECLPHTCKILEDILPSAVSMARMGVGEIIFSALAPGTKLKPHCASSNVRLTCHLGILCPAGAKLRVGNDWYKWEEGKCIFFDDPQLQPCVISIAACRSCSSLRDIFN